MKTLTRYLVALAGVVTLLVAVKVLIMLPPESNADRYSERHNKNKGSSLLWGKDGEDGHDELQVRGRNNDPRLTGEMGRGVILPPGEKAKGEEALTKYNVNVLASDLISLNRRIPDSRPVGCKSVQYPDDLPGTAVVIPFHNEWPSVLLRTIYSIINRTPKQLLQQIILVDDASDLKSLKDDLDHFIREHFPPNLVKLIRMPERVGLIRARLEGFRHVTAEVVSFFDSHMEVNVDWLQPLLVEIVKNRRTVAMGHLDYILPDTFEYSFTPGYRTRYGFDWRLIFFETYFLKSQEREKDVMDPLPGVVMVGPGFAINADYFREIGTYDDGMKIWGGENLELAWRVWLCGGRLVHLACSKVGHIARPQPYTFPEGRYETEIHNYKRAIEIWMGPYKKLVYQHHPKMKELDVGDLTERKALRDRLECKSFTWYLKNVWPELYPYGDNATQWGGVKNQKEDLCLDNNEFLFLGPEKLTTKDCTYEPEKQSFALTLDHKLRSVLQCVGVQEDGQDMVPVLITCHDEPYHTWTYSNGEKHSTWTYTKLKQLKHDQTGLCLQLMTGPRLVMQTCRRGEEGQVWRFEYQGSPTSLANAKDEDSPGPAKDVAKNPPPQEKEKTKSPRQLLDDFEKQLFLEKNGLANAQGVQGGPMQGGQMAGAPMMQGGGRMQGRPMMQNVGQVQRGPIMPGGGQMQGGPMMPGGGRMQGGPMMQGGGHVQGDPMMPGGGQMQGGPMMPGGAQMQGGPMMQGRGPMPGGGSPMMQGGGAGMQGKVVNNGVQNMQIAGGQPMMQPRAQNMQRGAPMMQQAVPMQAGGGARMQGGGPMPQGGGAVMSKGGANRQGGGMGGVRGGNMGKMPAGRNRGVADMPNRRGAGGSMQDAHLKQAAMQDLIDRQLYAEAKNAGKLR